MKQSIFKHILPSPAYAIATLVLPFALTVYFVVTQYSDRFITEQEVDYIDVQSNWIGALFLDQRWLSWFNRFMDFALWGLLALVVLLVVWFMGVTKIAVKNHFAQENFANFRASRSSWHGHFVVVAIVRFLLVVTIMYAVLSIFTRLLPQLSVNVSFMLRELGSQTVGAVVVTCLYIVLLQLLIASTVKLFKLLRA